MYFTVLRSGFKEKHYTMMMILVPSLHESYGHGVYGILTIGYGLVDQQLQCSETSLMISLDRQQHSVSLYPGGAPVE